MGIITSIALNYVQRKMLEDDPSPETVAEELFCAAFKLIQYGRQTLNMHSRLPGHSSLHPRASAARTQC